MENIPRKIYFKSLKRMMMVTGYKGRNRRGLHVFTCKGHDGNLYEAKVTSIDLALKDTDAVKIYF